MLQAERVPVQQKLWEDQLILVFLGVESSRQIS